MRMLDALPTSLAIASRCPGSAEPGSMTAISARPTTYVFVPERVIGEALGARTARGCMRDYAGAEAMSPWPLQWPARGATAAFSTTPQLPPPGLGTAVRPVDAGTSWGVGALTGVGSVRGA